MPFLTPKHLCDSFREPLRGRSRPVGLLFPGRQHGSTGCNLHCWHSLCPWLFLSHVSFMQTNPESSGSWFKIPESHKEGESIILVPRVSFFRGRREETVYNYAGICGGCCWGSPGWQTAAAWGRAGLQPISPLAADMLADLAGRWGFHEHPEARKLSLSCQFAAKPLYLCSTKHQNFLD